MEELIKAIEELIDIGQSIQDATKYTPKVDFSYYARLVQKIKKVE